MKVRISNARHATNLNVYNLGTPEEKANFEFHCYSDNGNIIVCENNILKLVRNFEKLPQINFGSKLITASEMKKNTIDFFNRHFTLHDVLYCNQQDMTNLDYFSDDQLTSDIKSISKTISPFDIPIIPINDEYTVGRTITNIPFVSETFPRKCPVTFNRIELGSSNNRYTEISSCIYGHEQTHVILGSQKGVVRNSENNELLSMFIEKLIALEKDETLELLRKLETYYLKFLCNNVKGLNNVIPVTGASSYDEAVKRLISNKILTYDDFLQNSQYIVSQLKAEHLFYIYLNGNIYIRNEIISEVQKVFDGNQSVEDLLRKYDITYENSMDEKMYEGICKSLSK